MADAGLSRSLRLPHATALVVGTILGASVFVQASELTEHVPRIWAVLLAWTVSGVLTLFGALACAELSSAFPKTGGVYVFLKETYSPVAGFLWGWAMFWVMHSGIIAAMATVFGRYAAFFVPLGDRGIRAVAVSAILGISALNYVGVKRSSTVQTAFTIGKVLAVGLIVIVGFTVGARLPEHFQQGAAEAAIQPQNFLLALIAGLFAFGGWHVVTYTAEETINPERTIPRALALGIVIVTACYVALNAVYFYILPLAHVEKSTRVAADAATMILGAPGGAAISGLVMFSVFGAMTGSILAAPRVYFAMAKDGLLFRWVSETHPRFHTPHRAIMLQAVWASVLVWSGTYRQLFTRVIFTEWIFFAMMAGGIFLLRKRPGYAPAYRVWGYPWVPAIFVVASATIVVNRLVSEPLDSAAGLALVALGVPAYYLWAAARPRPATPRAAHATPSV
ncbi:MAG: amino acid permease [Acidobacteriia bacterium]|nr:amino acid permease [Terriglobia bacterium]